MPRNSKLSVDQIFHALEDVDFLDEGGGIRPFTDNTWQEASGLLHGEMSKKYIYLYITQNRNNILDRLMPKAIPNESKNSSKPTLNNSDRSNWSLKAHEILQPSCEQIVIPNEVWSQMEPQTRIYKHRKYLVLKQGWADVLYAQLWDKLKLPCPFEFKNANINTVPRELIFKIHGTCFKCGNEINLHSLTEPEEDGLRIHVSTHDTRGIAHERKRQMKGTERKAVLKELKGTSTYCWRRDKVNAVMKFGDVEPAHLYGEDVLRKPKQLDHDNKLGVKGITDPIASIINLKYELEFTGCLKEISIDRFFVMYWSPDQIFMYKRFSKLSGIRSISIDATGSLIESLVKPDGSKHVTFVYQAVAEFNSKILPIFQMVSEKHDTNMISYWMREWLRSGVPLPEQVVTDYSLALVNAASLSFNNTDLGSYVEQCLETLFQPSCRVAPKCILRIDIAHLIKLVCRWKCFNKTPQSVKDFFVRCVGLLTNCTTIENFCTICTDVLTVAFSKTEDITDDSDHCFAAQQRLFRQIKVIEPPGDPASDDMFAGLEQGDFTDSPKYGSRLQSLLEKLETDSIKPLFGDRPNPYWCMEFGKSLLRLSKHFILWTNIMAPGVATSARSGEFFCELKRFVAKGAKSIRVDKFLIIHLRSIAGTMKLLNAPIAHERNSIETAKENPLEESECQEQTIEIFGPPLLSSTLEKDKPKQAPVGDEEQFLEDSATSGDVTKVRSLSRIEPVSQDSSVTDGSECLEQTAEIARRSLLLSILRKHKQTQMLVDDNEPVLEASTMHEHGTEVQSSSIEELASEDSSAVKENEVVEVPFLNEVESWRGLNTPPKKRGKYLSPCPDVESIHRRPVFCRTMPVLQNGGALQPVKVGQQFVKMVNTCPFDTIVQSILAAYRDWAIYHTYIDQSSNPTYEFVKHLSVDGITQKIYARRAAILSNIKKPENGRIDFEGNVASIVSQHLLTNEPSYERSERCAVDCGYKDYQIFPVVDVNPLPFYKNRMKGLQDAVGERSTGKCKNCGGILISDIVGGHHLVIDTECLDWSRLAARSGFPNKPMTFTLSELPVELQFCESRYRLVSAITYSGPSKADASAIGHYVAHIRRITGKWEIHNGLSFERKPLLAPMRTLLQQQKIHVLFYVKESSNEK